MTRRKKNSTKYILFAFFGILIAVGLFWGKQASADNTGLSKESVAGNDLLKVKLPCSTHSEMLDYEGFEVSFNPEAHQPNYVAWELTADETEANVADRKKVNFMQDDNVDGCATLSDYRGSGYSRGHMAPAADMKWSKQAMYDCHFLTNICPQKSELNTGAWQKLENKCRQWAREDSAIFIVCGPVLSDKITRTIGDDNVPVPERFFKVVLAPYSNPPRAIGFIMNNGHVDGGMQAAAVSVDEVEHVTGFDFFSALPDDIEDKVEAECNFPSWSYIGRH